MPKAKNKKEGIFNFNEQVESSKNKKTTKTAQKKKNNKKAEEHYIGTKELPPVNKKRLEKIKKQKIKEKKAKEKAYAKIQKKQQKLRKKRTSKNKTKQISEAQIKRNKKIKFIIKIFILIIVILGLMVYLMLSPIFNIKNIQVQGNQKITSEQIISLSNIEKEMNMFKISNKDTILSIKENPYIETVKIKRKFPDSISIVVTERKVEFMLEYGSSYVYIDKKGYILETSATALENIVKISGYQTKEEQLVPGNRLCEQDLEKLNDVLKIMLVAKNNEINNLITTINIENKDDYLLYLETEEKNVHLGDVSNLDTKMLYVKVMIEKEKNNAGEIFVNMDLNEKYPFFREKV